MALSYELRTVTVCGCFTSNGEPLAGVTVQFAPSYLWLYYQGKTWATLWAEVVTDSEGNFSVDLSPTDMPGSNHWYTVHVGDWSMTFNVEGKGPLHLSELVQ